MFDGRAWLTDDSPVSSPVKYTVASAKGACVTEARARVLFTFRYRDGASEVTRHHEILELAGCRPSTALKTDPRDWSDPDVLALNVPFGMFAWASVAIEGELPDARFYRGYEKVDDNRYRVPGLDGLTFQSVPAEREAEPIEGVLAMYTNMITGLRFTLRISEGERLLATVPNTDSIMGMTLGGRRFLIAGVAWLDPPLRLLEVAATGVLDGGPIAGVSQHKKRP